MKAILPRHMEETYLGWQRRYLEWCVEKGMAAGMKKGFEGFVTWLAVSGG